MSLPPRGHLGGRRRIYAERTTGPVRPRESRQALPGLSSFALRAIVCSRADHDRYLRRSAQASCPRPDLLATDRVGDTPTPSLHRQCQAKQRRSGRPVSAATRHRRDESGHGLRSDSGDGIRSASTRPRHWCRADHERLGQKLTFERIARPSTQSPGTVRSRNDAASWSAAFSGIIALQRSIWLIVHTNESASSTLRLESSSSSRARHRATHSSRSRT